MARRSTRSSSSRRPSRQGDSPDEETVAAAPAGDDGGGVAGAPGRSVASHVRDRQRAVAEREAARLARPERRRAVKLDHADKKKSGVTSTPFGVHRSTLQAAQKDGEEEEWCGPWSVARQMIAQREEARRLREEELAGNGEQHPLDELMKQVDQEHQRRIHPSLSWKGQVPASMPSSIYAKRQRRANVSRKSRAIPSLYQLCVDFVVVNFEYVESLGNIDNDIRVDISKELVGRNKLDAAAFAAFVEPDMETLEIVDCAGIPQAVMASTVETLYGLRYLLLTHAGRCFGPTTVQALTQKSKAPLCCLSISGAYLLTDDDAATLIQCTSSSLQSLEFNTCPLLAEQTTKAIHDHAHQLLELSLQELGAFAGNETCWTNLTSGSDNKALQNVQSLKLQSMPGLTDTILSNFLKATGSTLETLNIGYNIELTDVILSSIRQYNPKLKSLDVTNLKGLSAPGLETLFTYGLEGLPPPPKLKVLKLASIDHQAITDEVMELVTCCASAKQQPHHEDEKEISTTESHLNQSDDVPSPFFASYRSSQTGPGAGGAMSRYGTSLAGGLVQLDLQGSTLITDATLEHLASTSSTSLQDLNVSYCPGITDQGLGYLVSQVGSQLTKIHVWGCAQLTDEFLDGHGRIQDGSFEIVGAWMKKSGIGSLR
jgi:hypothetical protein